MSAELSLSAQGGGELMSRSVGPPPPVLRARAPGPPKQKHQGISEITDRYIGVTCAAGKKMISEKAQDEHFFVN